VPQVTVHQLLGLEAKPEETSSPTPVATEVEHPDVLIAMNEISPHKFAKQVGAHGMIIYNSSKLPAGFPPQAAMIYCVPAAEIADRLGTTKATNMVMLGALLKLTHTLPKESAFAVLKAKVRNQKLLAVDDQAIDKGMACLRQQRESALAQAQKHDQQLTHSR
jgi:2-oxoglutarate ferredoxin oxidoreductase subunit gamma